MIFKHESKAHKIITSPYLTTWLLIGILAVSIINLALPDGAIKMEKLRAGGSDNFAKVVELYSSEWYKSQQKSAIDAALAQFGGEGNPTPTVDAPTVDTTTNGWDDLKSELSNIKKGAYIDGNPNARFTVLEYSDLECPFCKRHHQNGTIAKLLENYPDDVNHIFRQFPLNNIHPDAQKAAEATECAGDQKWAKGFYAYINAVFASTDLSVDGLIATATNEGYNKTTFTSCINGGSMSSIVAAQLAEGQRLFGITGTPGNVLIDGETGKFVVIAWAYPYEKFETELKKMLAE